ncbi:hypothetical protein EYR41_005726 [Orbilia oligospora]|uniref:Uncharacterized protein n=1 Tax=Orbilia oligospora TaxID=2813651 RepID=A0A8H2HPX9_ORBOL|nr:hypothetical protein EYR41_005726 [Orbilia oligospora]
MDGITDPQLPESREQHSLGRGSSSEDRGIPVDDAFQANIKSPEDLLKINPLTQYKRRFYQLRWKDSCLDKPIFQTDKGVFWNAQCARWLLALLGIRMGFKYKLTPYSIRYGVSNSIEAKTTIERRQQIMSHLDDKSFEISERQ